MLASISKYVILRTYRAHQSCYDVQPLTLLASKRLNSRAIPMATYDNKKIGAKPITFKATISEATDDGVRLGTLLMPSRDAIETPNYVALSSRGAVPHISQDTMRDHMAINGIYAALEDCE